VREPPVRRRRLRVDELGRGGVVQKLQMARRQSGDKIETLAFRGCSRYEIETHVAGTGIEEPADVDTEASNSGPDLRIGAASAAGIDAEIVASGGSAPGSGSDWNVTLAKGYPGVQLPAAGRFHPREISPPIPGHACRSHKTEPTMWNRARQREGAPGSWFPGSITIMK